MFDIKLMASDRNSFGGRNYNEIYNIFDNIFNFFSKKKIREWLVKK